MNIPRRSLTAVTLPDGIYAIGGYDGNEIIIYFKLLGVNYLRSVEKYDESLNKWIYVC